MGGPLAIGRQLSAVWLLTIPLSAPGGLAVDVRMHDKQRALRLLARHLRLAGPHAIQNVE
jgi:hypothetical protein